MKSPARRITWIWVVLILATLLSWWLAERSGERHLGIVASCVMLGLSGLKGALIALDFMELRHAPPLWRRALLGWLCATLLLLLSASLWRTFAL